MQLEDNDIRTREVTEWRGLHLLHYDMSSCSQKVRILLGELNVDYVSHPINLMRNEQRTNWYLGINPNGVVPVLVHDGAVHIESNDIIEYLNQHFTSAGDSLLASTNEELQEMHALMSLEDQLHPDLRTVTFTYLAPDPDNNPATLPESNYEHIGRFYDALVKLEEKLANRPYLLGSRMTLADISWFVSLYRLSLAGYPLENHPNLQHYFENIARRPAFRKEVAAGPLLIRLAGSTYRRLNRLFRRSLPRDYNRWNKGQKSSTN